jgi:hypothetical protein
MDDKQFIINIGEGGTLKKSGSFHTIPQDIDTIFTNFENKNTTKICFYFHGGLVKEKSGLETARMIAPHLESVGTYPICFVWETGAVETIKQNIESVSLEVLFEYIRDTAIKYAGETLGVSPGGRGTANIRYSEIKVEIASAAAMNFEPFSNINSQTTDLVGRGRGVIDNDISDEEAFIKELKAKINVNIQGREGFLEAIESTKVSEENSATSKGILSTLKIAVRIAKIVYRVVKRTIQKRSHDFYPTVVEEVFREFYIADIGAFLWEQMKNKAEAMWADNQGRSGETLHGGRYFLDKLEKYKQTHPELIIDIIGHSAGSIVACHLMNTLAVNYPSLNVRNILLMAPACRSELFHQAIFSRKNTGIFNNIRIFTMTDEQEKKDWLAGIIYTRSLLYLVSGVLEKIEDDKTGTDEFILGMMRFLGKHEPFDTFPILNDLDNYLNEAGKLRVATSPSIDNALNGMMTRSLKHGDFDNDTDFTVKSLKFIIAQ